MKTVPLEDSGIPRNFWYFSLFMTTTHLFVIANVKQLQTYVVLEFYCFFPNILGCWHPKFSNFKTNYDVGIGTLNIFLSICNQTQLCQNFGISGGGLNTPTPPTPLGTPLEHTRFSFASYAVCVFGTNAMLHLNSVRKGGLQKRPVAVLMDPFTFSSHFFKPLSGRRRDICKTNKENTWPYTVARDERM